MKLSVFKKKFKNTDATYEEFIEEVEKQDMLDAFQGCLNDKHYNFQDIIDASFNWYKTKQGVDYWSAVYHGHRLISPKGEVFKSYEITSSRNTWKVGCQRINRKQRLKLFKLLAKDFGYELEGEIT